MSQSDLIGAACAGVAIALIAWLSLDSWEIANCRDVTADLQLPLDASATYPPEITRCVAKLKLEQAER